MLTNYRYKRHMHRLRFVSVLSAGILCIWFVYRVTWPQEAFQRLRIPGGLKQSTIKDPHIWENRAAEVRDAFLHAYHGYEELAAPADELRPLSNATSNPFNGWGVTIFDSLDTMILMGLDDEYQRALPVIESANFSTSTKRVVPYFETVIRYLGGLLSAHALTQNEMFLTKAEELALSLDPAFNTSSGFPFYGVNVHEGIPTGSEIGILAEIATLQMEYTYLAKLTGKRRHFNHANNIMNTFANANLSVTNGMFPIRWNLTSGQPRDAHISVGAQADSAHEYLLKLYLLTAKSDKSSLEMYLRATTEIITRLMFLSPTRHLLYVSDINAAASEEGPQPHSHVLEHLSCFLPGLLALGAHTLPLDDLASLGINFADLAADSGYDDAGYNFLSSFNLKDIHLWAAEGLAQTCYLTYADQPTGLGPEEIMIRFADTKPGGWISGPTSDRALSWSHAMERWKSSGARGSPPGLADKVPVIYSEDERLRGTGTGRDYVLRRKTYLLRPETIESLYILWRVTGESRWRDRGYEIFQAIERELKTPSGYACARSVERSPAAKDDSMPSYFLAETLKYLFLLFTDEDLVPLDKWVFNTEAHPFPVFEWTEEEQALFGIT